MKQNVIDDYNILSGQQKAAILMLSLDEERSAAMFSLMDDEEIKELSVIMASLGKVNSAVVEQLFSEFVDKVSSTGSLVGTYETTERLLSKALDKDRVTNIMEEIRGPAGRTMWDKLGNVNEHVLANYLKNEYPQTIAVILSKIKAEHAAKVIALLPENFAMEIVMRMIRMDSVQKEVLDSLEKTGLLENTVVVFAADNGLSCGHHGLFGKQNMYEHSMRVPLVFYGKGIPSGQKVGSLVYMHDLVPTVYEIAGISSPSGVEYRSFMKSIKNPGASQRNAVYGAFTETDQRMVCDGRYKLFFIPKARTAYLFDLKNDPEEMTDLFGDRKYSGVVERLAKKYLELSSEAGDPLDITQYYPEIFK